MEYSYNGNFITEEINSDVYDPIEVENSFYCEIHPEEIDKAFDSPVFGKTILRARITPVSIHEVKISGYKGTYKIYNYNNNYMLLQETKKGRKNSKRFLISAKVISDNKLRASGE